MKFVKDAVCELQLTTRPYRNNTVALWVYVTLPYPARRIVAAIFNYVVGFRYVFAIVVTLEVSHWFALEPFATAISF